MQRKDFSVPADIVKGICLRLCGSEYPASLIVGSCHPVQQLAGWQERISRKSDTVTATLPASQEALSQSSTPLSSVKRCLYFPELHPANDRFMVALDFLPLVKEHAYIKAVSHDNLQIARAPCFSAPRLNPALVEKRCHLIEAEAFLPFREDELHSRGLFRVDLHMLFVR